MNLHQEYKFVKYKYGALIEEYTHLFHNGKYHWMAYLMFDRFGFDQTSRFFIQHEQSSRIQTNKQNKRSAIKWSFPL